MYAGAVALVACGRDGSTVVACVEIVARLGGEMTAPWPCSTCGAPGVKNLGSRGYCVSHLVAFYDTRITPETWAWRGAGIGLPVGPIDDDGTAPLECAACSATWTGPSFTDCSWCLQVVARQRAWQCELVMQPPDVDPTDRRYDGALTGWAERLAIAVKAGLVTQAQAERALSREVPNVAA